MSPRSLWRRHNSESLRLRRLPRGPVWLRRVFCCGLCWTVVMGWEGGEATGMGSS